MRGFSPEIRERAVRMVLERQDEHDSQWAAIVSIAEKIGCSAETDEMGLKGAVRGRKFVRTTSADDTAQRPRHLVSRQFRPTGPNQLWVAAATSSAIRP